MVRDFAACGYSCWVSFDYADGIRPGEDYTEKIPPAIRSSKVFVLLISVDSMASTEVKKEKNIANDQSKNGLKILGIVLDDNLDLNALGNGFDYIFSSNQIGYWSDPDYRKEVYSVIRDWLFPEKISEHAEIASYIPAGEFFIGRDKEKHDIEALLANKGQICLYGMGGIGKTAVALQIAKRLYETNVYSTVIYLPVARGFLRSIARDETIRLTSDRISEMQAQSDYTYAFYISKVND